jgi:hypothetical protein
MEPGFSWDDLVQFEIPILDAAERLCDLLGNGWAAWINQRREASVVFVTLNPEPDDLAVLLRVVESWVEIESLCAIRYELDGRNYILNAGEPAWSALAA